MRARSMRRAVTITPGRGAGEPVQEVVVGPDDVLIGAAAVAAVEADGAGSGEPALSVPELLRASLRRLGGGRRG